MLNTRPAFPWLGLAVLAAMTYSGGAHAAAGKAIFVAPPVTVEHGPAQPVKPAVLKQGDAVEQGDVIVTGAKARAQLLMADGARIALRSNSRLRIDAFALPAAVNAPAAATAISADGRSFSTLLKGGLRTTSGAIGKKDPAAYELRTPVGTLGIRGTDYAAVLCQADCGDVADAPNNIRSGLYLSVFDGVIAFSGSGFAFELRKGESMLIPLGGGRPEPLQDAPAWVLGDGAGTLTAGRPGKSQLHHQEKLTEFSNRATPSAAQSTDQAPSAPPASNSVAQPVTGTSGQGQNTDLTGGNVPSPKNIDLAFSIPQLGASTGVGGVRTNGGTEFATSGAGALTALAATVPSAQGVPVPVNLALGSAVNTDVGSDVGTQLRWGRWAGGALQATVGGQAGSESLTQQSLHWIYADAANTPVMPQTGSASYTLVGGTQPTDNQGHVGTLGTAAFAADFTNQLVTSSLTLTINGANWTADGTGAIGAQAGLAAEQFQGVYQNVSIGALRGAGNFSGFFGASGGTQGGVPGAAGLTFLLTDNQGLVVNGALAFRGP
jgi:hypothetical protein